jgi:hypothetical protein
MAVLDVVPLMTISFPSVDDWVVNPAGRPPQYIQTVGLLPLTVMVIA